MRSSLAKAFPDSCAHCRRLWQGSCNLLGSYDRQRKLRLVCPVLSSNLVDDRTGCCHALRAVGTVIVCARWHQDILPLRQLNHECIQEVGLKASNRMPEQDEEALNEIVKAYRSHLKSRRASRLSRWTLSF